MKYLDSQISGVYQNLQTEQKNSEQTENKFDGLLRDYKHFLNWEILILSWLLPHFHYDDVYYARNFACFGEANFFSWTYDYLLDKTKNDYRLYSKEKIEKNRNRF